MGVGDESWLNPQRCPMRSRVVADRECPLDGLGKVGSSAYDTEILTVDHSVYRVSIVPRARVR